MQRKLQGAQGVVQPELLPSLPRVRRQTTRRIHQDAPEADIEIYKNVVNPNGAIFPEKKEYASAYERRQANKLQQAQLMNLFKQKYPGVSEAELKARIADAKEGYLAFRNGPKPKMTPEEEQGKALYNMRVREWRKTHPTGIYDDKYKTKLQKYDADDDLYEPAYIPVNQRFQNSDPYREYAGDMFAELTGVMGMRPVPDDRLLSLKAAKQVYPEDDYHISVYDMDHDDNTPYNIVVRPILRDKYGEVIKDERGQVKLGPIVAANGYKLQSATAGSELNRLKRVDYMETHPTKKDRKKESFATFIKESEIFGSGRTPDVMVQLANWIRRLMNQRCYRPPREKGTRYIGIQIGPSGNTTRYDPAQVPPSIVQLWYRVPYPAWATLTLNMAKLFAINYIYPRLRDTNWDERDKSIIREMVMAKSNNRERNIFSDAPTDQLGLPAQMATWDQSWTQIIAPSIEALVLSHPIIKEAFMAILENINDGSTNISTNGASIDLILSQLGTVVCKWLMNWQYPLVAARVEGYKPTSLTHAQVSQDMQRFLGLHSFLLIYPNQQTGTTLAQADTAGTADLLSLSAKTWKTFKLDYPNYHFKGEHLARKEKAPVDLGSDSLLMERHDSGELAYIPEFDFDPYEKYRGLGTNPLQQQQQSQAWRGSLAQGRTFMPVPSSSSSSTTTTTSSSSSASNLSTTQ